MQIDPSVWQALRRAVEHNDPATFQRLLVALAEQTIRDERGRQGSRLLDYGTPDGREYLACCRR